MNSNPKRTENLSYYKPSGIDSDQNADFYQLLAFFVGFVSMMIRYKWGIWISLFLLLSSFFNMKSRGEYKNIVLNFMIIAMGLVTSYFWTMPLPQQPQSSSTTEAK